ncbi:unnamed protein product [Dicrocoelium dendriticum]|nr:unnamed protein product [Dicrocoelium dendriticum]
MPSPLRFDFIHHILHRFVEGAISATQASPLKRKRTSLDGPLPSRDVTHTALPHPPPLATMTYATQLGASSQTQQSHSHPPQRTYDAAARARQPHTGDPESTQPL